MGGALCGPAPDQTQSQSATDFFGAQPQLLFFDMNYPHNSFAETIEESFDFGFAEAAGASRRTPALIPLCSQAAGQ